MTTMTTSTRAFSQFVYQNMELLERLYEDVKSLNNTIQFLTFCEFVYHHSQ